MNSMEIEFAATSDIGLVRDCNEDSIRSFCLETRQGGLCCFAVADGVGGHQAGDIASRIAVCELERYFETAVRLEMDNIEDRLQKVFALINKKIYDEAKLDPSLKGMGTTLTTAVIHNDSLTIGHVGDSRAYLFREDELRYLTNDHSLVGELMAKGKLSREEARFHPQRNIITRAMGTDQNVVADVWKGKLLPGDFVVLCTDGLTDLVSEEEIAKILSEIRVVDESIVDRFVSLARERGAHDNVSIIIVQRPLKRGARDDRQNS